MNIDKVTLKDLSFLGEENSVFSMMKEACTTQEGIEVLRKHVLHPPDEFDKLKAYQKAVFFWMNYTEHWPKTISNGTLVMVLKFYEAADVSIEKPSGLNLMMNDFLKWAFHKKNYSFELFSLGHLTDFLKGCFELTALLDFSPPDLVQETLMQLKQHLEKSLVKQIIQIKEDTKERELLLLSYRARTQIRSLVLKTIRLYARLDALHAMAVTTIKKNWQLPELLPAEKLICEVIQLKHPLIKNPVGYDLKLDSQKHFLFLTGANMSGKSTLLYALGIGALLAHLGMGVPAEKMKISFFKGLITNIHIEDNITLGESYFFAEVQRMKLTAQKLKENPYQLVLMDELFKGTNGYDAYECSLGVIKSLLKKRQNLMALSTHLSELSEKLNSQPEILFRYCETIFNEQGAYQFSYRLKEGVSKDRIGFLVLKKEGVIDLLDSTN